MYIDIPLKKMAATRAILGTNFCRRPLRAAMLLGTRDFRNEMKNGILIYIRLTSKVLRFLVFHKFFSKTNTIKFTKN